MFSLRNKPPESEPHRRTQHRVRTRSLAVLKERTVVEKLAAKLRDRNQNFARDSDQHLGEVHTWVNPARSPRVNSLLRSLYGGLTPRMQPEIDIVLKKGEDIRAIEVKFFKIRSNDSLSLSYYEGIDQALALLMYGFNKTALWHVFDQDIELSKVITYGSVAQVFIVEQLRLPINFTAIRLERSAQNYEFTPTKPILRDYNSMEVVHALSLVKIHDPRLKFVWTATNPLLEDGRVQNIRAALMEWLNKREQRSKQRTEPLKNNASNSA